MGRNNIILCHYVQVFLIGGKDGGNLHNVPKRVRNPLHVKPPPSSHYIHIKGI